MTADPNEGYIKFKCEWEKDETLPYDEIKELNDARQRLFELNLIGAYDDGTGYGNISRRYKDDMFMISGSATGNIKITNEHHYTLITEYNIEKNYVRYRGHVMASSETMTHAALYHLSYDINCIIHIHNINIWKNNINNLPSTSPNASYGTQEMAYEIERLWNEGQVAGNKVIIMSGHESGIIIFGESINAALDRTLNLI